MREGGGEGRRAHMKPLSSTHSTENKFKAVIFKTNHLSLHVDQGHATSKWNPQEKSAIHHQEHPQLKWLGKHQGMSESLTEAVQWRAQLAPRSSRLATWAQQSNGQSRARKAKDVCTTRKRTRHHHKDSEHHRASCRWESCSVPTTRTDKNRPCPLGAQR